jgi:hypothetical protein
MVKVTLFLFFASFLVGNQVAADGNDLLSIILGPSNGFSDETGTTLTSWVSTDRHRMQDFADTEDFEEDLPIDHVDYDYEGYNHYRKKGRHHRRLKKKSKLVKAPAAPKAPAARKAPASVKASKKRRRNLQDKKSSKKAVKAPAAPKAPVAPKAPAAPKASKKRVRKLKKKNLYRS